MSPTPTSQDGRHDPHPRRFVCSNPNLREPHAFTLLPRDTRYYRPSDKAGRVGRYICHEDGSRLWSRRTVKAIPDYPDPESLLETLARSGGWPYDEKRAATGQIALWRARDRALVSLLYVGMLRVSEALRLRRGQFEIGEAAVRVTNVALSKRQTPEWRKVVNLPTSGERAPFTRFITQYIAMLDAKPSSESDYLLFEGSRRDGHPRPLSTRRAWDLTYSLTGAFNHFFRAVGEDYMAHQPGVILPDLGAYLKVNPAIIATYVHNASKLPVV